MKTNVLYLLVGLLIAISGCQDDDATFGDLIAPTNLQVEVAIAEDQSGNVTITPTADNAINFHVIFIEGEDPVIVNQSGEQAAFRYGPGQFTQIVTVIAFGTGGSSTSQTLSLDLDVVLTIDPQILEALTGSADMESSKEWVWDAANAGHLGVGDPLENFPNFFSAAPFSSNDCLYDDTLTFSQDGQGTFTYNISTNDATFVNWAEVRRFFPDASPQEFVDECRDISDQIATDTDTSFEVITDAVSGNSTLRVINSTLSFWSGATVYDILELTPNRLVVRGVQDPFDPPGAQLAWYHTFVPANGPVDPPSEDCLSSGFTGMTGNGDNTTLIWADEFNINGAPCDTNWGYDIGTGDNGWGNGESQFYTDRADNVIVEDGFLKITAKRENFNGSEFTSTRMNTKDLFEFQYGRAVIRAKLPTGGGTWPALWTLGADFETNPWPAAGEMDIMEHVGNQQDRIFSTVHFPGNSGGNAIGDSFIVDNVSNEFHTYEFIWTPAQIRFLVDGEINFIFQNNSNLPFNKDFFLIMNVAMGGTFGGAIDPAFDESTMEVDFVRVYQ